VPHPAFTEVVVGAVLVPVAISSNAAVDNSNSEEQVVDGKYL